MKSIVEGNLARSDIGLELYGRVRVDETRTLLGDGLERSVVDNRGNTK